MSYSCFISFIALPAEDAFDFLSKFKVMYTEKLKEIARENYAFCPFNRNNLVVPRDFAKEITREQKEEAKSWAQSVFKHKFFYNKELSMLGVFGVPDCVRGLFDGTVYFQNSTDQDYAEKDWQGIATFEALYRQFMSMTDDQVIQKWESTMRTSFKDEYEDIIDNPEALKEKLDYWRRSFCYKKIWSHFENYLYNDSENVFLSIYGGYEIQEIYSFIKFCHEAQIAYEDENPEMFGPIRKRKEAQTVSIEELVDDIM